MMPMFREKMMRGQRKKQDPAAAILPPYIDINTKIE